jgi:hypothetical protein
MGSGPFALHFVHGVVFGENSLPHSKRPDNAPRRPLFWRIIPGSEEILILGRLALSGRLEAPSSLVAGE